MRVTRIITVVLGLVTGACLVPLTAGPASAAVTASYDSGTKTVTINDDGDGHTFTIIGWDGDPSSVAITAQTPIPLPTPAGSNCTPSNADKTLNCTYTDVNTVVINGNGGNDTISFSQTAGPMVVAINGGIGNDTLTKGADNVVLAGGEDDDTLRAGGGALKPVDTGGPGDDTYLGGSKGDSFDPTADPGADTFIGGAGVDSVTYAALAAPVFVSTTGVGNDGPAGEHDTVVVETVTGGHAADILSGGPANEILIGGDGNDVLTGGTGVDTLTGGVGNDDIRARDGVTGNDQSDCGVGTDTLALDDGDGFDISCEKRIVSYPTEVATKAKVKGKNAAIRVTCPAATACKGRLVLTLKGKTVGTASFRVKARGTAGVAVKLSKKARSKLADKGKLKVTVAITASDAAGPLPSTTAKVTLKRSDPS